MTIDSISGMGGMQSPMDKKTFGASVVTKTLDAVNGAAPSAAPTDQQTLGAAVVNKTLDYMNSDNGSKGSSEGSMEASYKAGKDILDAHNPGGKILDLFG